MIYERKLQSHPPKFSFVTGTRKYFAQDVPALQICQSSIRPAAGIASRPRKLPCPASRLCAALHHHNSHSDADTVSGICGEDTCSGTMSCRE